MKIKALFFKKFVNKTKQSANLNKNKNDSGKNHYFSEQHILNDPNDYINTNRTHGSSLEDNNGDNQNKKIDNTDELLVISSPSNLANSAVNNSVSLNSRIDNPKEIDSSSFNCEICYFECSFKQKFILQTCNHAFCIDCLKYFVKNCINTGKVLDITCPCCDTILQHQQIKEIIFTKSLSDNDRDFLIESTAIYNRYEDISVRHCLLKDPDTRWCPAPNCSFAIIAFSSLSCPKLQCFNPECRMEFCYLCRLTWHPNMTCRESSMPILNLRNFIGLLEKELPKDMSLLLGRSLEKDAIKSCPKCKTLVVKSDDGSCNHMFCTQCGYQFCWKCLKSSTEFHFLNPSGCSFIGYSMKNKFVKYCLCATLMLTGPFIILASIGITIYVCLYHLPKEIISRYIKIGYYSKLKNRLMILSIITLNTLFFPVTASISSLIISLCEVLYIYMLVPYTFMVDILKKVYNKFKKRIFLNYHINST